MAAATKHNAFVQNLARKVYNLHTDTIKVALCTTTPAAIDVYASLSMEVANGNGYTTGGVTLTGQSATQTSGTLTFDATDPAWTGSSSGFTFRYAWFYDNTATNKEVIQSYDYGSSLTINSGDSVTLVIAGTGILTLV